MAYNRAPRRSLVASNQTGPNVSPNSYQGSYQETCCSCKGTNWAPFLSCTPRTIDRQDDTPGPDTYYPQPPRKIVGGASLRYTAPRFPDEPHPNPGPTEYDPYHASEEFQEEPPPRLKGYLYHCNVPYTLLGYMPSIPTDRHIGYKIDHKMLSECCDPEDNDTTLGPAFYHVNFDTFGTCYRGSYWSKYSKRPRKVNEEVPGVGTYDLEQPPSQLQDYLDKVRHERRKSACLPRYLDQVQSDAIRNNYPAPNEYNVVKVKCVKRNIKLVPKRIIRPRKPICKFESPAPNQYNDPRTALQYLIKPSCKEGMNAFLSNAPRFGKEKPDDRPAPNQYYIQDFVELMQKKVSPYAVRRTAFDTSVPKKLYFLPPDYPPLPKRKRCLCSAVPVTPEPPPPKPRPTYPFSATADRFPPTKGSCDANCASYSIHRAFVYTTSPLSFRRVERFDFLFKEKRFGRMTGFGAAEDKTYIPMLAYNLQPPKLGASGAGKFGKANRFPGSRSSVPGPLHYGDVSQGPRKRTFNVTLGGSAPLAPFQKYRLRLQRRFGRLRFRHRRRRAPHEREDECPKLTTTTVEFGPREKVSHKKVAFQTLIKN